MKTVELLTRDSGVPGVTALAALLLQRWAAEPARRLTVTESAALGPNTEPGCSDWASEFPSPGPHLLAAGRHGPAVTLQVPLPPK